MIALMSNRTSNGQELQHGLLGQQRRHEEQLSQVRESMEAAIAAGRHGA